MIGATVVVLLVAVPIAAILLLSGRKKDAGQSDLPITED